MYAAQVYDMNKEGFLQTLKHPAAFWAGKSKEEVRALLGAETAEMVGFDQRNPHHAYPLFVHCVYAAEEIAAQADPLLRTAAFFHDIGKPAVAFEKEGRLVFYGHAKESAALTEPILEKLGFDRDEILEVRFYIEHHDDFMSWMLPTDSYDHKNPYMIPITTENLKRHMQKTAGKTELALRRHHWENLLELCRADALAQADIVWMPKGKVKSTKGQKLRRVEAIRRLLEDCADPEDR